MENEASAIQYSLMNSIEYAAATAKQIYMNEYIERYLNCEYAGPLAYVEAYQDFVKTTLFKGGAGMDNSIITMYADNPTIVNGGEFSQLSAIENADWYRTFKESGLYSTGLILHGVLLFCVLIIHHNIQNNTVRDHQRQQHTTYI